MKKGPAKEGNGAEFQPSRHVGIDEEVIFRQPSKLAHYIDNKWQQLLATELYVLRHKQTLQVRFLMLDEDALKPYLDCVVNADTAFQSISDCSFAWITPENIRLSLSFSTRSFAHSFSLIVDRALSEARHLLKLAPQFDGNLSSGMNQTTIEEEAAAVLDRADTCLPSTHNTSHVENGNEVIFSQISKLSHGVGGKLEELSTGILQLLRQKDKGELRLLMYDEKMLEVVNYEFHYTIRIILDTATSSCIWTDSDNMTFQLSFKDSSLAEMFKTSVENARRINVQAHSYTERIDDEAMEYNKSDSSSELESSSILNLKCKTVKKPRKKGKNKSGSSALAINKSEKSDSKFSYTNSKVSEQRSSTKNACLNSTEQSKSSSDSLINSGNGKGFFKDKQVTTGSHQSYDSDRGQRCISHNNSQGTFSLWQNMAQQVDTINQAKNISFVSVKYNDITTEERSQYGAIPKHPMNVPVENTIELVHDKSDLPLTNLLFADQNADTKKKKSGFSNFNTKLKAKKGLSQISTQEEPIETETSDEIELYLKRMKSKELIEKNTMNAMLEKDKQEQPTASTSTGGYEKPSIAQEVFRRDNLHIERLNENYFTLEVTSSETLLPQGRHFIVPFAEFEAFIQWKNNGSLTNCDSQTVSGVESGESSTGVNDQKTNFFFETEDVKKLIEENWLSSLDVNGGINDDQEERHHEKLHNISSSIANVVLLEEQLSGQKSASPKVDGPQIGKYNMNVVPNVYNPKMQNSSSAVFKDLTKEKHHDTDYANRTEKLLIRRGSPEPLQPKPATLESKHVAKSNAETENYPSNINNVNIHSDVSYPASRDSLGNSSGAKTLELPLFQPHKPVAIEQSKSDVLGARAEDSLSTNKNTNVHPDFLHHHRRNSFKNVTHYDLLGKLKALSVDNVTGKSMLVAGDNSNLFLPVANTVYQKNIHLKDVDRETKSTIDYHDSFGKSSIKSSQVDVITQSSAPESNFIGPINEIHVSCSPATDDISMNVANDLIFLDSPEARSLCSQQSTGLSEPGEKVRIEVPDSKRLRLAILAQKKEIEKRTGKRSSLSELITEDYEQNKTSLPLLKDRPDSSLDQARNFGSSVKSGTESFFKNSGESVGINVSATRLTTHSTAIGSSCYPKPFKAESSAKSSLSGVRNDFEPILKDPMTMPSRPYQFSDNIKQFSSEASTNSADKFYSSYNEKAN